MVLTVWWQSLLGGLAGVLLVYLFLVGLLWNYARRHPGTASMHDALRLLPDLVRLIRRLAADRHLAKGVRVRLALVLIYLASPVDLIPDFIPIIGYADDAVIVALVLRSVVRRAGPDAVTRNWPGTPQGLQLINRLVGRPESGR